MTPSDPALPTVEAASLPPPPARNDRTVAGIVLAAGTSDRFGERNKLLAEVGGGACGPRRGDRRGDERGHQERDANEPEPIVRRSARTLVAAGLEPIVAVLGADADRIRDALADLPVRTVVNDDYREGQASSVRTGIEAVRTAESEVPVDAAVVALGDMPWVSPETIDALVAAHATGVGSALAPSSDGTRGNPVCFDRRHFDALATLEGDVGGRRILLEGDDSALVAVDDPGVLRDVDRPEDLGCSG